MSTSAGTEFRCIPRSGPELARRLSASCKRFDRARLGGGTHYLAAWNSRRVTGRTCPGMLLTAVLGLGIAGHWLSRAGSYLVLPQADSRTTELQKICKSGSRHCLSVCVWFSLLRDKKWCGRRTGAQQGKPERFKSHGQESASGLCGGAGHSGQTVLAAGRRQDQ